MDAIALHEEGQAAAEAGRHAEACALFAEAADRAAIEDGPNSPDLANILSDYAESLMDLLQFATAVAKATQAVQILETHGEALRSEIGATLYSRALGLLGSAHRHAGNYTAARPPLEQAIAVIEAEFGATDFRLVSGLNNVGVLCKYAGSYAEGEAFYRRALAIVEAQDGVDSLSSATLWHNLGGLEHSRGEYAKGEPMGRKAYEIRRAHEGEESLRTLADACAWAGLLDGLERYGESEPIYRRALAIYERELGPTDFEVAATLNNLGMARLVGGDVAEATVLLERAYLINRELFGADHPETQLSRRNFESVSAA